MRTSKKVVGVLFVVSVVVGVAVVGVGVSPITLAQPEPPTPTQGIKYYAVETKVLEDGTSIDQVTINGPPTPPPGFEIERAAVPEHVAAVTLLIPAYDWSYGCSATSAAMIAAYYDRTLYPNMYTGPTNGGVMPMNNSTWGSGECPLSATHQGIDGRATRGHVDDYWISYGSAGPDPWVGNWPEHTIGDCTGDYMETNKWYSAYGFNIDGETTFWFDSSGAEAYATSLEALGPPYSYDGGLGVKQFYESRGYTVTTAYNQYIQGQGSNPSLGFTYDQYKAEIDAGRPVMIHLEGHTIVGVGYDDSSSDLMYIHDTWDYNTHTMIWGSSYSGMDHVGVTIVQLEVTTSASNVGITKQVIGSDFAPGDPITFTLAISNSGTEVASQVVVTDMVPSEVLTPTFASTLAVTQTGVLSYVWDVEPLGTGESGVITIYGWIDSSLDSAFSFDNTATISDPEDDTPGNNTSSVTVGGRKVYLPLVLKCWPLQAYLYPVDNPDGDGMYTVSWSWVSCGPSPSYYQLQGDDDTQFGNPSTFTEYDTTFDAYSPAPGTYYWRVRAYLSGTGWSKWSNVQSVTVGSFAHVWIDNDTGGNLTVEIFGIEKKNFSSGSHYWRSIQPGRYTYEAWAWCGSGTWTDNFPAGETVLSFWCGYGTALTSAAFPGDQDVHRPPVIRGLSAVR